MKTKIQPLGENILIQVQKNDTKTKSGLVLPETINAERPQEGRVMAIGESKEIKVKKGQQVIFAKYTGTEIKIDGESYLLIKNEDILAVIQ